MIQKFTCVPITDYDVIVVSDGTKDQINSKLSQIKDLTNKRIPKIHTSHIYLISQAYVNIWLITRH